MDTELIKSLVAVGVSKVALGLVVTTALLALVAACHRLPSDPPEPTPPTVACDIEEGVFVEGLNGTCTATAPGQFDMEFRNDEGTELFNYTWQPGGKRPTADCPSLCSASVFYWASQPQVALLVGQHMVAEPATCDGGAFNCFGCCGQGCATTVALPVGICGPDNQCILTEFRGYTKTCCYNHDGCVATANTLVDHITCTYIAVVIEGCVLKDAWGGGSGDPCVGRACLPR